MRTSSVVAPWLRTRLRAAPGAACALATLIAVTACLAAAFPRALDRYQDEGLRAAFTSAPPARSTLQFYAPAVPSDLPRKDWGQIVRPATVGAQFAKVAGHVEESFAVDRAQSSYGVRTTTRRPADGRTLPKPDGLPPRMGLVAQDGLPEHARLLTGRYPRATGKVGPDATSVEAVATEATAKRLRLKPGTVFRLPRDRSANYGGPVPPLTVRITGVVAPRGQEGAYWSAQPLLRSAELASVPRPVPSKYWEGTVLVAPEAAATLLGTDGNPERYWHLAPDTRVPTARELPRLTSALASLLSGTGLRDIRRVTDPDTDVDTGLDEVFVAHQRLSAGIAPLVSVAAVGTGTVAAVVLLMAAGLAADRRRMELALLRARGASVRGLSWRLLAETAVVALPAGAAGLAVAVLALPSARLAPAVAAAAAVVLLSCAALPVRAAFRHAVVRVHTPREDLASARPSRRRTVADLTLLALAVGAVVALRRRGTSDGGSAGAAASGEPAPPDLLVSLAPLLVGVIVALVLVRLYPLLLRVPVRRAARLRGAVGYLSFARAGRTSAAAVLPLLALLTALTTAAFGGSVLSGVDDVRARAALSETGADGRVDSAEPLPARLVSQVGHSPGVRDVVPAALEHEASPASGGDPTPLAAVDPASYARLARDTGLGSFDAAELKPPASFEDAFPALASPSLSERFGNEPFTVLLSDGTQLTVRISVVRDTTPALRTEDFLVVDRSGLGKLGAHPTTLLLTGTGMDGKALRDLTGQDAGVRLLSEARAAYADSPLQSGAERVYATAVLAGAGYAVLTLVLTLVWAAPERRALLARLRTLGMTRAQGRRLLVLESLPQALPATLGGVLAGWAAVRLLAPGTDLSTLALAATGSATEEQLHTDPWSLLLPALAVLLLSTGIAAAQAWWTGRRSSVRELRAGDGR